MSYGTQILKALLAKVNSMNIDHYDALYRRVQGTQDIKLMNTISFEDAKKKINEYFDNASDEELQKALEEAGLGSYEESRDKIAYPIWTPDDRGR